MIGKRFTVLGVLLDKMSGLEDRQFYIVVSFHIIVMEPPAGACCYVPTIQDWFLITKKVFYPHGIIPWSHDGGSDADGGS